MRLSLATTALVDYAATWKRGGSLAQLVASLTIEHSGNGTSRVTARNPNDHPLDFDSNVLEPGKKNSQVKQSMV